MGKQLDPEALMVRKTKMESKMNKKRHKRREVATAVYVPSEKRSPLHGNSVAGVHYSKVKLHTVKSGRREMGASNT